MHNSQSLKVSSFFNYNNNTLTILKFYSITKINITTLLLLVI